jgi:LSD1 subclass zinc finger protein
MEQTELKEYRCLCGKLLFKGMFSEGTVEIKCKSCRKILSFLGSEYYKCSPSYSHTELGGENKEPVLSRSVFGKIIVIALLVLSAWSPALRNAFADTKPTDFGVRLPKACTEIGCSKAAPKLR